MKKFEIMAYLYDIIWDLTNFFFHLLTFSHRKIESSGAMCKLMKEGRTYILFPMELVL